MTRQFRITHADWHTYESFLLKAARANATVIPAVVQILVSYNANGYDLGRDRVTKLVEDLIGKNAPLAHHAEVAWALFLAKGLRVSISRKSTQAVSGLENSVCALLILDLRARNLIQGPLDTALWELSMTGQGLLSHMWLLAYEADLKGWLTGSAANFVENDRYFSILKRRRISFYDVRRNVLHIRKERPTKRPEVLKEFLKDRTSVSLKCLRFFNRLKSDAEIPCCLEYQSEKGFYLLQAPCSEFPESILPDFGAGDFSERRLSDI
jgi:hypothetical protein